MRWQSRSRFRLPMITAAAGIAVAFAVLGVENSVRSRTSYGGTAPDHVRAQITRWKEILA